MNTTPSKSGPFTLMGWLPRRKHLSCLQIQWAGVLRTDHDQLVPEPRDEIRFQAANQMYLREEGKRLDFDESWNPEAWHGANGCRVVFMSAAGRPRRWRWLTHFIAKLARQ